ncbi:zinc-ribbon domain containing protein [Clostridium sp. UBA5988]|uniref:zinc-ribbon domain containing protein n=1 Tax=Clostridium sp. UBA5988 TaxID=1946369 RepID=UPI003216FB77
MLEKVYEDDIVIKCKNCGEDFVITKKEQEFYEEKEFELPKRCYNCRKKKYTRKDN